MKFRDRTTGGIYNTLFDLQLRFPNVSFPVNWDESTYDFANVDPVVEVAPPAPSSITTEVISDGVKLINGQWTETWIEIPLRDTEALAQAMADTLETQWGNVRSQRELFLEQSDFTMMPDCPITPESKQEFITYRQALRDITETQTDPFNIAWPIPPIYVKN